MDWLAHRARTHPDTTALIDADLEESWTYSELSRAVDPVSRSLAEQGVGPGSWVGTLTNRSPTLIRVVWATIRLGGTVVPIDPSEPASTIKEMAALAELDVLVRDEEFEDRDEATLDTGSIGWVRTSSFRSGEEENGEGVGESAWTEPASVGPPFRVSGRDSELDRTIVALFTSGTTGERKGVRLTARNIGTSAAGSAFRLGVEPGDRWLLTLPLHHMGGLSIPFRAAIYGTSVVIEREFDAESTRRTLAEFDVTGVSLVPTMLDRLLEEGETPDSLRFVLVGGAPTPKSLVRRALDADVPIHTTYGMTETTSQVATATPAELRTEPATVGRPIRTASVGIVDEEGGARPQGSIGEIQVSGPIVSPGYLGESGERTGDGAFETGDLGYLDTAGRLFVTGRRSDLIITGGENVSPEAVRDAILALPGVEDAAVVGVPDPEWGERVAAMVVLDGEPPWTDLRTALRDSLAAYQRPRTVTYVDEIPRTDSGTVDRSAVRRAFTE